MRIRVYLSEAAVLLELFGHFCSSACAHQFSSSCDPDSDSESVSFDLVARQSP